MPDAGEGDAGMMMSDAGALPDGGEAGAAGGGAGGVGGAGGASGDGAPTAGAGSDPSYDAGCEIIVNESADCSCRIEGSRASGPRPLWLAISLVVLLAVRRRRHHLNAHTSAFQLRSR